MSVLWLAFATNAGKRPTTPYQRVASRLKPVVSSASSRIARVNTLQLIQKVAAVNQIEKLYRFGSHHFGLRNRSFQFSGLFGFCTFLRRRLDLFRCLGRRFVTPIMRGSQMIDHALEDLSRIYFCDTNTFEVAPVAQLPN